MVCAVSIMIHIYYTGHGNAAREFAQEMISSGLAEAVRAEEGCLGYEYFFPMGSSQTVLLVDCWRDQTAIDLHHKSPMMDRIAQLRKKYRLHMRVERYLPENPS